MRLVGRWWWSYFVGCASGQLGVVGAENENGCRRNCLRRRDMLFTMAAGCLLGRGAASPRNTSVRTSIKKPTPW